jgi:FG-GAP repeat
MRARPLDREVVEVRRIAVVLVLVLAAAVWPAASAQANGSATAAAASLQADSNNDGFADLAVAASFEDVGAIPDAGVVHVLHGTPTGLTAAGSQLFTQDSPGMPDTAEAGDLFAETLAASGAQRATAPPASPSRSGVRRASPH